ncbi:MAG: HDOD domain-containing protein [Myxococcales bacterium]|nr:MAG: HDOD domain-containing protein [Myxococcales bacterium]
MSNIEAMRRALTEVVSKGDFTVPPYPAVAMRLQRVLARDNYAIADVADVVATDAPLAATVLAAANSALVAGASPITSLSRAVNRLGARTVGSIALASGVGALATSGGVLQDVKFRVWRRGVTCALACQKLAPASQLDPEEAFLAGLLHGFGRSVAVASLERLLKTYQPPRPLTAVEWLNIADQHRAVLAHAVAESWQLPTTIAEAIDPGATAGSSALADLVVYADQLAADLDAGRMPAARAPSETPHLDELIASLPATLDALAPQASLRPSAASPLLAKPERALTGELRHKSLPVVDRKSKGAAELKTLGLTTTGLQVESSRPFQESSMVRLAVGGGDAPWDIWFNVALCVASGARYRVELELFSPTRESRERWRALFDAP